MVIKLDLDDGSADMSVQERMKTIAIIILICSKMRSRIEVEDDF